MENNDKANFGIIKETSKVLKQHYTKAFIGAIIFLVPIFLVALIPWFGIPLAVLMFGHMSVGYIRYIRQLLNGEDVSFYTILEIRPNILTETLLGTVLVLLILFGSLVFVIPAILVIAFFSMSLHVFEHEKSASVLEIMRKSASLMKGKIMSMLVYKMIYYILYALMILLFALLFLFVETSYVGTPILAIAISLFLIVIFFLIFAAITTYFITSNVIFYDTIVKNKDSFVKANSTKEKVELKEKVEEIIEPTKEMFVEAVEAIKPVEANVKTESNKSSSSKKHNKNKNKQKTIKEDNNKKEE